jgi:hypothetical protein
LLAKLREKRGGNQQIQLIKEEPHGEDPRFAIITRRGIVIGEDRVIQGKTIEESRVGKDEKKTQEFDPRKEKQIFEEVRKEFRRDHASSSKVQPKLRECGMPLAFDQSASPRDGKEVSKLVSFLYTFIELIKNEKEIQELQNLVRQYEIGRVDPLLNKVVHQLSKKRRTNK